MTWAGAPHDPRYRTRVQARQAFVFASAAAEGLGPWAAAARHGLEDLTRRARREDGLFKAILDPAGAAIDAQAYLYEHAFVLLALAALGDAEAATALRVRLEVFRHGAGGFREAGEHPFQANAQMHLLEAALAWEETSGDAGWGALADELVALALNRFIDPATGALSEFFDDAWRPLAGPAGLIEPGHQFEWAWLLVRWGRARGRPEAETTARRLFAVGRRGFDPTRNVAVDALTDDLAVRDAAARLWPQTEHVKAALALGDTAAALQGANGMAAYLDTPAPGVWRERMRADGGFVKEPSPATSLYHLYLAIRELTRFAGEPC
nr:AGE family epimerase/isomerase [Phenylobacterium sp. RIFCSPHIGHO2_01_FULL_69_31]